MCLNVLVKLGERDEEKKSSWAAGKIGRSRQWQWQVEDRRKIGCGVCSEAGDDVTTGLAPVLAGRIAAVPAESQHGRCTGALSLCSAIVTGAVVFGLLLIKCRAKVGTCLLVHAAIMQQEQ